MCCLLLDTIQEPTLLPYLLPLRSVTRRGRHSSVRKGRQQKSYTSGAKVRLAPVIVRGPSGAREKSTSGVHVRNKEMVGNIWGVRAATRQGKRECTPTPEETDDTMRQIDFAERSPEFFLKDLTEVLEEREETPKVDARQRKHTHTK